MKLQKEAHYNQTVDSQGQKGHLGSNVRTVTHHVQGILNKINSRFLIRGHGCYKGVG